MSVCGQRDKHALPTLREVPDRRYSVERDPPPTDSRNADTPSGRWRARLRLP